MKSSVFRLSIHLCFFLIAVISTAVHAAAGRTIRREADPIIIPCERLHPLLSTHADNVRVFKYVSGKFLPIPFQIDERGEKGDLVFPFGPQKTTDSDNGIIDANDELVLMALDLAGAAPESEKPAGAGPGAVITITDPLDGGTGYAYAFTFKTPPAPSGVDYVSITEAGDFVKARNFEVGFSEEAPIGFDHLAILPAGGGDGLNTVDRLKIRVHMVIRMIKLEIDKSESDFESELLAYIDGPVRVIRRTSNVMMLFWKIAAPATMVDNVFYYNSFEFPTKVHVPFDIGALAQEFRFRVSTDGNENQVGKAFVNQNNLTPTMLDGVMTEAENNLDLSPYKWSVAYGTREGVKGGWVNRLEYDAGIEAVPKLYYVDDVTAGEPPENDPGQIGALGYDVLKMETVKQGWWTITSIMYNTPDYKPGDEKEFLIIRDYPVEVSISEVE